MRKTPHSSFLFFVFWFGGLFYHPISFGHQNHSLSITALNARSSLEIEHSDKIKSSLHQTGLLNADPQANYYLESILRNLLVNIHNASNLSIFLMRNDEKNAGAWLGGYITIYTGLVGIFESENELAGVIAHEIAHILLRHVDQLSKKSGITPELLAGIAAGIASKNLGIGAGLAASILQRQSSAFSRAKEQEADLEGMKIMKKSSTYSPWDMISGFQNMAKQHNASPIPYLQSHPLSSQRIAYLTDLAKKLEQQNDHTSFSLLDKRFGGKTLNLKPKNTQKALSAPEQKNKNYGFTLLKVKSLIKQYQHDRISRSRVQTKNQDIYEKMLIQKMLQENNHKPQEIEQLLKIQSPYTIHLAAQLMFQNRNYVRAAAIARQNILDWPEFYPSVILLASIQEAQNSPSKAVTTIHQYLEKYDNKWFIQDYLVRLWFKAGDQFQYWLAQHKAYSMKGQFEESTALLKKAKEVLSRDGNSNQEKINKLNQLIRSSQQYIKKEDT